MSFECAEVSVVELVWLNLGSISGNDSISDTLAELVDLVWSLVFSLDSLVLSMLSLFSLLSMLFIKAERMSVLECGSLGSVSEGSFFVGSYWSDWWVRSDWRSSSLEMSHFSGMGSSSVVKGVMVWKWDWWWLWKDCWEISSVRSIVHNNISFALLSVVWAPETLWSSFSRCITTTGSSVSSSRSCSGSRFVCLSSTISNFVSISLTLWSISVSEVISCNEVVAVVLLD